MESTFSKKAQNLKCDAILREASRRSIMTPFDFTDILATVTRFQDINRCSTCNNKYYKTWCPMDLAACLFCKTYAPHPYVYTSMLRDAEWYSLKHGVTEPEEATDFYKGYVEAAQQWCQVYGIPSTRDDKLREQELTHLNSAQV